MNGGQVSFIHKFTRHTSQLLLVGALAGCLTTVYRPTADTVPEMTRSQALLTVRLLARTDVKRHTELGYTIASPMEVDCEFAELDVEVVSRSGLVVLDRGLPRGLCARFEFQDKSHAIALSNAMYALKHNALSDASDPRPEVERFAETARQYRAVAAKPALTESARRYRVQAELAVQQKRWVDALLAFGSALATAPWWPEGHFNSAIILAELNLHDDAIAAMRRYLQLAPDAADARAAQDRIYQWEALATSE